MEQENFGSELEPVKSRRTWLWIVIILILVGAGGSAAYYFSSDKKAEDQNVVQTRATKDEPTQKKPPLDENGNPIGEPVADNQEDTQAENSTVEDKDLVFTPDSGFRIENASNPGVKVSGGTYSFLFENRGATHGWSIATSADGLTFSGNRKAADDEASTFRAHKLPGGTYRAYAFSQEGVLTSKSSTDGVTFTADSGTRYTAQASDKGKVGVYDFYNTQDGKVVMLYIGDLMGVNNVRMAISNDNGLTFTFDNDNVFGDKSAGGGSRTYVDQKTIVLPDGRVRAIVMKEGILYSFISADGKTFAKESGTRLAPTDFKDTKMVSLHDPQIVQLADGRFRIYVNAALGEGSIHNPDPNAKQVIVSATTSK